MIDPQKGILTLQDQQLKQNKTLSKRNQHDTLHYRIKYKWDWTKFLVKNNKNQTAVSHISLLFSGQPYKINSSGSILIIC